MKNPVVGAFQSKTIMKTSTTAILWMICATVVMLISTAESQVHCGAFKYDGGRGSCVGCPVETTKLSPGATYSCDPCEPNSTTTFTSSNPVQRKCVCEAGFTPDSVVPTSNPTCSQCPIGTYRELSGTITSCSSCGSNLVTATAGATSEADCITNPGYFYDSGTGDGEKCPVDTASSGGNRDSSCPACTGLETTNGVEGASACTTAVSASVCGIGQYVLDPVGPSCDGCLSGTYNDDPTSDVCFACRDDLTTQSSGSSNDEDCGCVAGFYAAVRGCEVCPMSSYKSTFGPEACLQCYDLDPNTVAPTGSTSASDCLCNPGYFLNSRVCTECPLNSYKETEGNAIACDSCPANSITSFTASSSSTLCECIAGYKWNSSSGLCDPCSTGTFKDSVGNGDCVTCPNNSEATSIGARSCLCSAGYELEVMSLVCSPCPVGSFKEAASVTGSESCSLCSDKGSGLSSSTTGSTACSDCAGDLWGTALVDECGVCGDPSDGCVISEPETPTTEKEVHSGVIEYPTSITATEFKCPGNTYKEGEICVECPTEGFSISTLALLMPLLAVFGVIVAVSIMESDPPIANAVSILTLSQVVYSALSTVPAASLPSWASTFTAFLGYAQIVSTQTPAAGCIAVTPTYLSAFYQQLVAWVALMVLVVVCTLGLSLVTARGKAISSTDLPRRCFRSLFLILFGTISSMFGAVLPLFYCVEFPDYTGDGDAPTVMYYDVATTCWVGSHLAATLVGIVIFLLHGVLFTTMIIKTVRDRMVAQKHLTYTDSVVGPSSSASSSPISEKESKAQIGALLEKMRLTNDRYIGAVGAARLSLCRPFSNSAPYFPVVWVFIMLVQQLVKVFLTSSVSLRLWVSAVFAFLAAAWCVFAKPFIGSRKNFIVPVTLIISGISVSASSLMATLGASEAVSNTLNGLTLFLFVVALLGFIFFAGIKKYVNGSSRINNSSSRYVSHPEKTHKAHSSKVEVLQTIASPSVASNVTAISPMHHWQADNARTTVTTTVATVATDSSNLEVSGFVPHTNTSTTPVTSIVGGRSRSPSHASTSSFLHSHAPTLPIGPNHGSWIPSTNENPHATPTVGPSNH